MSWVYSHHRCHRFELKSLTFELNPCRPVDVVIYALSEMTPSCLIVLCLSSPCCQLEGPRVPKPITLVVWLTALHKNFFPPILVKIGLFSINFSEIIMK